MITFENTHQEENNEATNIFFMKRPHLYVLLMLKGLHITYTCAVHPIGSGGASSSLFSYTALIIVAALTCIKTVTERTVIQMAVTKNICNRWQAYKKTDH